MTDTVVLYADGSFRPPNKGSYATYMTWNNQSVLISEFVPDTTINRMELMGVSAGLSALTRPCTVQVYSDSQYTVNSINKWLRNWKRNGWKSGSGAPVKNKDLMEILLSLMDIHKVKAHWVKGHSGNWQNELCNERAQYLTL